MMEMFWQMTELEQTRNDRRDEEQHRLEEARQQEDRVREARRWAAEAEGRVEERLYRQRREEIKDKLAGFVGFRDGGDLSLYLDKFEHVMRDCEVPKEGLSSKLYSKLPERLCARVRSLVETGEDYSEVKCALLRSVGETVATYGNKLFSLSTDTFKAMTADQFIEFVYRILGGLFQKVKTLDEGIFVLARAIARHY